MVVEECVINSGISLRFYSSNSFQCYLANFSKFLVEINFGWICNSMLFVIIGISIFGRIKENYRWLILYQAIWDFGITYDFICEDPVQRLHSGSLSIDGTCFYSDGVSWRYLTSVRLYVIPFFKEWIKNSPYLAVFLLSFTRFLALYCMNFYKRLTEKRRIFWLLLGFTVAYMATIAGWQVFDQLYNDLKIEVEGFCDKNFASCYIPCDNITDEIERYQQCYPICNNKTADCKAESSTLQMYSIFWKIFLAIHYLTNLLLLLLSSISMNFIIVKISKQAKFQAAHNKKDFYGSIRIATVLALQTIITVFLFIIQFFDEFKEILFQFFNISAYPGSFPGYTNIDLQFPEWLDGPYGLTRNLQTFRQLRIFLEAIFVLCIMTGYREAIIALIKLIYNVVKDPQKIYQRSTATTLSSRIGSRSRSAWSKKECY